MLGFNSDNAWYEDYLKLFQEDDDSDMEGEWMTALFLALTTEERQNKWKHEKGFCGISIWKYCFMKILLRRLTVCLMNHFHILFSCWSPL